MESVLLIGVDEPITRQLRSTTEADGAVLAHVVSADEAIHELKRTDQRVAVMVLGPDLREPIQALQKIHSLSSDLAVLVLVHPDRLANLKKAVMFAPLIGRHVACVDISDTNRIAETVQQSITSARQRKSYLSLVTSFNQGLAARRKSGPSHPETWKHAFVDRLLESVPMGIASISEAGAVLSWNPEASVIFDQSESEVIGLTFADLFSDPEAKKTIRSAIKRATQDSSFRSTPVVFTVRNSRRSSPQSVELSIAAIQGKEHAAGAIALFQDVTDRVLAHRHVAEREELFRSFFSIAAVGIAQTDAQTGRFLRTNAKMQAIVGYSESELSQLGFRDITHPDDLGRDLQHFSDLAAGRISSYSAEKRYVRKEGQVIWALINVELVRDSSGNISTMLAAVQDITRQKQSEESLRNAVQARDEFLSVASHELKTPISSLKLNLQTIFRLMNQGKESLSPRVETKLKSAVVQTDRLTDLIDDLLEVTRMANGKLHYEFDQVDLNEIVQQALSHFADEATAAGCTLSFHSTGSVIGHWDRFRLDQVVSNLISNAIRYGHGTPIVISLAIDGAYATLSVKDHGIGIPADAQERIFDRFEQMSTSRKVGGLGLGLYIVKQIVTAHGGSIQVNSSPGKGATFTVLFPI